MQHCIREALVTQTKLWGHSTGPRSAAPTIRTPKWSDRNWIGPGGLATRHLAWRLRSAALCGGRVARCRNFFLAVWSVHYRAEHSGNSAEIWSVRSLCIVDMFHLKEKCKICSSKFCFFGLKGQIYHMHRLIYLVALNGITSYFAILSRWWVL